MRPFRNILRSHLTCKCIVRLGTRLEICQNMENCKRNLFPRIYVRDNAIIFEYRRYWKCYSGTRTSQGSRNYTMWKNQAGRCNAHPSPQYLAPPSLVYNSRRTLCLFYFAAFFFFVVSQLSRDRADSISNSAECQMTRCCYMFTLYVHV